jgi:hypothetical protein
MPKGNKKGKHRKAEAAVAQADDAFDEMLAEIHATDLTTHAGSTANTISRAMEDMGVSEETVSLACIAGDITQLRQWARQGGRVRSEQPLLQAAWHCKL